MIRETVNALLACLVTLALCAVAYPAAVWALGWLAFPHQAAGSLVERDGKVVGSELIAQPFASDKYFRPRPSAAGPDGYAADAASGSNLGPKNPALRERIALDAARQIALKAGDAALKAKLDRLDSLQGELKVKDDLKEKTEADTAAITRLEEQVASAKADVVTGGVELGKKLDEPVPVDLVTASGGGLDPHISPEAAYYQVGRVASARKMSEAQVRGIVDRHIERSGALIGAPPRVNVLRLNLALDEGRSSP